MKYVEILTLVENTVNGPNLLAEHGLSYLIKINNEKFLFDTGQGYVLLNNVRNLNVNFNEINAVILSHGHYDHVGGLEEVLKKVGNMDVYTHPDVFIPKYSIRNDKKRSTGMPKSIEEYQKLGAVFHFNRNKIELNDYLILTGEIPRNNDFETVSKSFYIKKDGNLLHDNVIDDQALVIKTQKGLVVVLGCAHSGVVNTLEYISEITGEDSIYAVLGGTHLNSADDKRINETISILKKFNVKHIAVSHCTGFKAAAKLYSVFGENFSQNNVGSYFKFSL
jgi:7,8-dihydropterin-6-yl-methyl-4-(beta-D-ribofuranosyl)aminobenzene 5'-phosphate synthase